MTYTTDTTPLAVNRSESSLEQVTAGIKPTEGLLDKLREEGQKQGSTSDHTHALRSLQELAHPPLQVSAEAVSREAPPTSGTPGASAMPPAGQKVVGGKARTPEGEDTCTTEKESNRTLREELQQRAVLEGALQAEFVKLKSQLTEIEAQKRQREAEARILSEQLARKAQELQELRDTSTRKIQETEEKATRSAWQLRSAGRERMIAMILCVTSCAIAGAVFLHQSACSSQANLFGCGYWEKF